MAYIVKQPKGDGITHLYLTRSHRVPGKANPVQTRTYLGVLDPASSELLLGKGQAEPGGDVLALLHGRGIGYSGKRVPSPEQRRMLRKTEALGSALRGSRTLEAGRVILLERLAGGAGLPAALAAAFGESDGMRLLAAAIYECCEGDALCRLGDWLQDTVLADAVPSLSPASVTRLCQDVGASLDRREAFFREWFRQCNYPRALISDTTSISSYAEKLEMVEWGHNRDRENLPQVNLNMVHARLVNLPLYYRLIHGSVPDVATIVNTAAFIAELGISQYSFALDRGFFSAPNLFYFHDHGLSFTVGVPLGTGNKEAMRVLDECRLKLRSFKSTIVSGGSTLNHAAAAYRVVQKGAKGEKNRHFTAFAHVYLNKSTKARQERELQEVLHGIMKGFSECQFQDMEEAEEWVRAQAGRAHAGLFKVTPGRGGGRNPGEKFARSRDGGFCLGVAERAYAAMVKNFGIFMILNSDAKPSGEQTLLDNKSRDCQEKIFDILKNATGNDRLRISGDDSLEGRLFIAFLAVALHKMVENKLRKAELLNTMTVNKAMDLARKFKVVQFADATKVNLEVPLKAREVFEAIAPGLLLEHGVEPGEAARKVRGKM